MHVLSQTSLDPLAIHGIPATNNLCPAFLGQFNGENAIAEAYQAHAQGVITRTGLTAQDGIAEVDAGKPLVGKNSTVQPGGVLEQLEQRLHSPESLAIVEVGQIAIRNPSMTGTMISK